MMNQNQDFAGRTGSTALVSSTQINQRRIRLLLVNSPKREEPCRQLGLACRPPEITL